MPSSVDPRELTIGQRDLRHWRTPIGRAVARVGRTIAHVLGPRAVFALPLALGLIALTLTLWLTGETYEAVVGHSGITVIDQPVLDAMKSIRSTPLNWAAIGFTQTGGPIGMPIIATIVTIGLAARWKSWTPVVLMIVAVAGSLSATIIGKRAVGRLRPPLVDAVAPFEHSPSLPSGHSLNSIVIGGVIAYLLLMHATKQSTRWWIVAVATVYALTMGLTRIYLGHHWTSDVLIAWTIGAAWLTTIITAHRLFLTARVDEVVQPSSQGEP